MPMSELTIEDTWFVAGMKGTGSNTIVTDWHVNVEIYGKALLGVEPNISPLI